MLKKIKQFYIENRENIHTSIPFLTLGALGVFITWYMNLPKFNVKVCTLDSLAIDFWFIKLTFRDLMAYDKVYFWTVYSIIFFTLLYLVIKDWVDSKTPKK